jgi:hypothetical protein
MQAPAQKRETVASQHTNPKSDIEISQAARKRPIIDIAREKLGIAAENLEPYGHYKAKVSMDYVKSLQNRPNGKLILVSAITPTRPPPRLASPTPSTRSARKRCCACASRASARPSA